MYLTDSTTINVEINLGLLLCIFVLLNRGTDVYFRNNKIRTIIQ